MSTTKFLISIASVITMVASADMASGQNYPSKPLRIVVSGIGSGAEILGRVVANGISGPLGQNVIVDSRSGAVVVAAEVTARAAPDGYTFLLGGGVLWTLPLMQKTSYDPVRDFTPLTIVTTQPNVLVVNPSVPAKSVKELIALAKSKPGELNYAIGAIGGNTHLAAELFKSMAGINMVGIPYKSGGGVTAVLGGEVHMYFAGATDVEAHIRSGRVRALAVTSLQPSALFPGLPTVADAASMPGYEFILSTATFLPAKTPASIVKRLNEEIVRFISKPETKARLLTLGADAVTTTPNELAALMKAEMVRNGKLYKDLGLSAQ